MKGIVIMHLENVVINVLVNNVVKKKVIMIYQKVFFVEHEKKDTYSIFTKKSYSNLSIINIHYYIKLQIPIMHRHFFRKLSQNSENVQTPCNKLNIPFHFACRNWYLHSSPQG